MPATSIDTFFACTILVAVTLIAITFTATTLQAQINGTQDTNKDVYLKAIADHILTSPGSPDDWATRNGLPTDLGLAVANPINPYELDMDKISRLNILNSRSLTYFEISQTAKLSNIAIGISISQAMALNIYPTSNVTMGSNTSFTFQISTSMNSIPTSANLHGYILAENYQTEITFAVSESGEGQFNVAFPTAQVNSALMVVFAKANMDARVTSYAIYDFHDGTQQTSPGSTDLALSPLNFDLNFNDTSPGIQVSSVDVLSYSYQRTITSPQNSPCSIPKLMDTSPLIIVAKGITDGLFFQEWTSYPQIPLITGSNFDSSTQNIYSYLVSINGVLYRLDLSLGDVFPEDT